MGASHRTSHFQVGWRFGAFSAFFLLAVPLLSLPSSILLRPFDLPHHFIPLLLYFFTASPRGPFLPSDIFTLRGYAPPAFPPPRTRSRDRRTGRTVCTLYAFYLSWPCLGLAGRSPDYSASLSFYLLYGFYWGARESAFCLFLGVTPMTSSVRFVNSRWQHGCCDALLLPTFESFVSFYHGGFSILIVYSGPRQNLGHRRHFTHLGVDLMRLGLACLIVLALHLCWSNV